MKLGILLPFHEAEIIAPLKPLDAVEHLRAGFRASKEVSWYGIRVVKASPDAATSLPWITAKVSGLNSYLPICKATVEASASGSVIILKCFAPGSILVFAAFVAIGYLTVVVLGAPFQLVVMWLGMGLIIHTVGIVTFSRTSRRIERAIRDMMQEIPTESQFH